MLMVSELLSVARGERSVADLGRSRPDRFGSERVPVVVWNVCKHCNQLCPHCYISAGAGPSAGDLSTAEGLALIDDLAACGVRVLVLSGGEPLLRPDITDLAAHAVERGLSCHLSSNGVLLDSTMAKRLAKAGVGYVGISIDGGSEFNDSWRGMAGGFAAAAEGLRAARAEKLRTGVRITLTRRNRGEWPEVYALAREVGAARFYVSHLLYSGRARQLCGDDLAPTQARQLLFDLFAWAERELEENAPGSIPQVVTGGNDSDGVLLAFWVADRYGAAAAVRVRDLLAARGGNSAGEGILNIDNRGRVHPDQFWTSEVLADLRRESFAVALSHPLRGMLSRRTEWLTGRCGACSHISLCRGSHRERALAAGGGLDAADPACVLDDTEIASASFAGAKDGEVVSRSLA